MKPIYLYAVAGLVIIGLGTAPLIVKKQVDSQISERKVALEANGIELNQLSDEGYLNSKREIEIKIIDGLKFKDYLIDEISKKDENFALYAQQFKTQLDMPMHKALDGTTFKGFIENSNLLVGDTKVTLSLVSLSDEFMKEMQEDKPLQKVVQPILDSKLITFYLDMTSSELKKLTFKDIDTTFDTDTDKTKLVVRNHFLSFDHKGDALKGLYNIDKQQLEVLGENKSLKFSMGKLEYKFDYTDQFNQSGSFGINDINMDMQKYSKNTNFHVNNFIISSLVKPNKELVSSNINYAITGLEFKERSSNLSLESSSFGLSVNDANLQSFRNLTKAYQKLYFKQDPAGPQEFLAAITGLVNHGFKSKLITDIKSLHVKDFIFQDGALTLNTTLMPNTFAFKENITSLLSFLVIKGQFKALKSDVATLLTKTKKDQFAQVLNLGKEDGDYFLYDIEFDNSTLKINGKQF